VRLVVDTNVLIAGIRSPGGASAALLVLLLERRATTLLSVSMAFEYESVALRPEHLRAAAADEAEVRNLLDAIIDVVESVEIHYL
jgi:predicted nucleic acid-binding protein